MAGMGYRTSSGRELARLYDVKVKHPLYHHDGTFYENLKEFPGALFDARGYKVFQNRDEYQSCPYLRIGVKLNVKPHISAIPGYQRFR